MTVFEFVFGLNAVILGLGLAEMAMRLQQLVFAGRRVRWAPEPALLAAINFLVIVVVWLAAWQRHGEHATTVGEVVLQLLSGLAPFVVAVAVFPQAPGEEGGVLDLHAYYDRSRKFLFGGMIVGRLFGLTYGLMSGRMPLSNADAWTPWLFSLVPYTLLMFVRRHWFNIAVLLFVLVAFCVSTLGVGLSD